MVTVFGVALALSALLPVLAGSAVVIPLIVIMVVALIVGWIMFLKFLRMRKNESA